MSNPSRQKGTGYEVHVLEKYLLPVWPTAGRRPLQGVNDYGDFLNVDGLLIEAKKRARLAGEIVGWVKTALTKTRWAAHKELSRVKDRPSSALVKDYATRFFPWVVFFSGDRRVQPDIDLAIMPASLARDALRALKEAGEMEDRFGPRQRKEEG